jgi:hypothetical protein
MKTFLQNTKFKLDTVWWDIAQGHNRHIWRAIIALSVLAGTLLGKAL